MTAVGGQAAPRFREVYDGLMAGAVAQNSRISLPPMTFVRQDLPVATGSYPEANLGIGEIMSNESGGRH